MLRKGISILAIAGLVLTCVSAVALAATEISQFAPALDPDTPGFMRWILNSMSAADNLLEWLLPTSLSSLLLIVVIAAGVALASFSVINGSVSKSFKLVSFATLRAAAFGVAGGATIVIMAWIFSFHWSGWLSIPAVIAGLLLLGIMDAVIEAAEDVVAEEK